MNNKENAGGLLCTDEERLLISRATELSERSENSAVALSFLTPREQRLVFEAMTRRGYAQRLFMWGGYAGAERRRAIFLPSWLSGDDPCPALLFSEERERYFLDLLEMCGMTSLLFDFVSCIKLSGSGYATLSHRDFLGALMALGLKRSVVGDISVIGDGAVVFCENKAGDFIAQELKKAGRDKIVCEKIEADIGFSPERRFEEISTTVASPRLDGIVRALLNISREEALRLVTQGAAEVNYFLEKEPDRIIKKGDILSVRGYGKYMIDCASDLTRRGRIRLSARKYV